MRLTERLEALEREGRPLRVAVIGAGQMGHGVARGIARVPGMRLAGVADLLSERSAAAAHEAGVSAIDGPTAQAVEQIVADGRTALTHEARWLIAAPGVGAVVDATGDVETGARLAVATLARGVPFITMNVEADVTVGPVLAWLARSCGGTYTVAAGDEPSALCEMVDFARAAGFEVICAGKGKNNRLDRSATWRSVEAEALKRGMGARMLASFIDGTKTMVEMAALANATGLRPDCPGLHGPRADLKDLVRTFIPASDGGILRDRGVVDYAIGDVAPGVFLVVSASQGAIRRDLAYLKAGDGPYYLLHRPYHLASLEAPLTVARAALYGEVVMAAAGAPVAVCVAVAKRTLRAGEILDGIGGETVYGLAETATRAAAAGMVSIGVVAGARVLREVAEGTVITAGDVALDDRLFIVALWRLQDVLVRQGTLPQIGRLASPAPAAAATGASESVALSASGAPC